MIDDHLTHEILAAALRALNAAAGELTLLVPAVEDPALSADARVLAEAVEGELTALAAAWLRWEERNG